MSRSLALLVLLGVRARYRRLLKGMRTLRGLLLIVLGTGFIALMFLFPLAAQHAATRDLPSFTGTSPPVQRFGPAGLLAFVLLSLFTSSRQRGVFFSPAEVDFLFPAPFRRRELLLYRLLSHSVHILLSVPIMALFFGRYLSGFWQTAAGLFLVFLFLNTVQLAASLLAGTLEERLLARGRRFAGIALGVLALLVFASSTVAIQGGVEFRDSVRWFLGSRELGWALLPLKTFSETLTAPDLQSFLGWAGGALAVNAAVVALVLRLDVDFTEASLETSRRHHERLRRMRAGGRIISASRKLRLSLPMFPRVKGVGPLAWRQAQELVREVPGVVYLLVALTVGALLPQALFGEGGPRAPHAGGGLAALVVMLPFLLSNWFRYDFRGDLERMEALLALPLAPWKVALGQLLTPTLVLTALQTGGIVVLGLMGMLGEGQLARIAPVALLLSGPFNLLFVAVENLFFLIYPARLGLSGPGDLQTMGRLALTLVMKLAALASVGLVALSIGTAAYQLSDGSLAAGFLGAAVVFVLADLAAVQLVGWAFSRFDVSRAPAD